MVLLFNQNGLDGRNCVNIDSFESLDLLLQVAQNNLLNCDRCGSNCTKAAKSSNEAKRESTDATEVIAAAAPNAATLKLGSEYGAVFALVRLEFSKFRQKIACSEPCDEELAGIDVYRAVLASMIDLEYSLSEPFSRTKTRDQFHEVQRLISADAEGGPMERNVKSHVHPRSGQDPKTPSTASKLTNQPTLRAEDAASEEIGNISASRQAQTLYARAKGMPQRPPNPG